MSDHASGSTRSGLELQHDVTASIPDGLVRIHDELRTFFDLVGGADIGQPSVVEWRIFGIRSKKTNRIG